MPSHTAWKSSGVKGSSVALTTSPAKVAGIEITADGTNAATIELINGGAGGTTLLKFITGTAQVTTGFNFAPVDFDVDLYLKITTSGTAEVTVIYR